MRQPLIAGNWKMHGTRDSCRALAIAIAGDLGTLQEALVAIFPPYPCLHEAAEAIRGTGIALGAQDLHPEAEGAFTGAVSGSLLRSFGCRYVLAGHSERRRLFGETDDVVKRKISRALASDLNPVLCVGESAEQREAGEGEEIVHKQVRQALAGLDSSVAARLTLAYEPVWAIGSGRPATPQVAAEMHALIRDDLRQRFGMTEGSEIRILYGGSVTPENAGELLGQEEIDGLLVGGASLDAASFSAIARAAVGTYS